LAPLGKSFWRLEKYTIGPRWKKSFRCPGNEVEALPLLNTTHKQDLFPGWWQQLAKA